MRVLFLLLVTAPFFAAAQINRSATELAKEKIADYIVSKIFKGVSYKPVSYGALEEVPEKIRPVANWSIMHRFEIIDSQFVANKRRAVQKPYYFSFYLDKKLNVVSAERFDFE
jgi:hypothetical protein